MRRRDATVAGRAKAGGVPGVFAAAGLIAALTLAARVFGFGRWLVFSQSVGTTCVGSVYQAANLLPNVVFEVAAGGALAAVVVPIIAGQLARQDDVEAARTASAMLTWTLAVLAPLSVLLAASARLLSPLLVDEQRCPGSTDLMASMLVLFSPQIALYGIGIVLAGVLQAHRRFLGVVMAPLLSSLVVMVTYPLFAVLAQGRGDDLTRLPGSASLVLAVGTTLGVAALSLPLLVPLRRAGLRLRPTWAFPEGVARRAGGLAGAGVLALAAQQVAVLATLWVAQNRGGTGTLNVYTYVQAVYLLPYAVLAVPFAMSALPALTTDGDSAAAIARAQSTLASSARAIVVTTSLGAAVLLAIAAPTGAFFTALDAGRHSTAGRAALAALPDGLSVFAPGLVGFGMAALLTRALYVRGRPSVAGALVAAGWLVAALVPLLVLPDDAGPRKTLLLLGLASSSGMTVATAGLIVAVRRAWGREAFTGFARSAVAALGSGCVAAVAARRLAYLMHPSGLVPGAAVTVSATVVTVLLFAGCLRVADPESTRLALARFPGMRR